jgi:hypothetical protein
MPTTLGIRDVDQIRHRRLADLLGDPLGRPAVPVGDQHLGAPPGEEQGGRLPDAGSTAGHGGHLACEILVDVYLLKLDP